MIKTIIRAPLLSVSGYGVHSRQIFSYLENSSLNFDISTEIVSWGNTPWLINTDFESGMIGRIMSKTANSNEIADISFQIQLPNEWDSNLARVNVGVSAVVETDVCNPDWVRCCNEMDAIIVPSLHARKCLERSGELNTNVYVVPEWFFNEINTSSPDHKFNKDLKLDTDFNFLIISQLTGQTPETDRKNLFYTIKWLCEEFSDDPDVGVVLKTNHGRGTTIDRTLTSTLIRKVISEVRPGSFPKFHLVHGNLYPEEISSLYRHPKIKSFISLTRGEGFGLPLLEAAASNLPVITTNWSAHTEFLSLGNFISIDYDLVSVPPEKIDNEIFFNGSKWANPREADFKKKVRKFRNKSNIPASWAGELGEKIRSEYSSESIMKKYDIVVEDIIKKCF